MVRRGETGHETIEYVVTQVQLDDMLERAVERGAAEALKKIGLDYEGAGDDVKGFTSFLDAYKAAKRTAIEAAIKWVTLGVVGFMAAAIYFYGRSMLR